MAKPHQAIWSSQDQVMEVRIFAIFQPTDPGGLAAGANASIIGNA
jgi:hypothetical protein